MQVQAVYLGIYQLSKGLGPEFSLPKKVDTTFKNQKRGMKMESENNLEEEFNENFVDLPNAYDIEGAWVNIGSFESRQEAIEFAKEKFGADDEGRIYIIS